MPLDIVLAELFHQLHEEWGCFSSEGALSAFPGFSVLLLQEWRGMGQAAAGGLLKLSGRSSICNHLSSSTSNLSSVNRFFYFETASSFPPVLSHPSNHKKIFLTVCIFNAMACGAGVHGEACLQAVLPHIAASAPADAFPDKPISAGDPLPSG